MILIYLCIKGLPASAKLIFGVLLGSAFLFLVAFAVWQNYFFDTLAAYVPADSDYYVHISKTDSPHSFDRVVIKMFADYNLSQLKPEMINREMAVFGSKSGCSGLVLRVKNTSEAKGLLGQSKVKYYYVGGGHFFVSDCALPSKKMGNRLQIGGGLSLPGNLKIYLSGSAVDQDLILKSICGRRTSGNGCVIDGQVGSSTIRLFKNVDKKSLMSPIANKINNQEFDLAAGGPSLGQFIADFYGSSSSSTVENGLAYLPSILGADKISHNLLLLNRKSTSTESLWRKFDLYWAFDLRQELAGADINRLEDALKTDAAFEFPSPIVVRLSDGTKVTEMAASTDKFKFVSGQDGRVFTYPDGSVSIYYRIFGSRLIVTNKKEWLDSNYGTDGEEDFLAVKTDVFPDSKLFDYVKLFQYVWADSSSMYFQ